MWFSYWPLVEERLLKDSQTPNDVRDAQKPLEEPAAVL